MMNRRTLLPSSIQAVKTYACIRPNQPVKHRSYALALNGSTRSPSRMSRRSRLLTVRPRCQGPRDNAAGPAGGEDGSDQPLYLPATASTYCPFSAELLLATTRLGHLERYRQEVQQLYEPGTPVDLTRMALLISNIYQPQLDHRTYFQALEYLLAAVGVAVMRKVAPGSLDGSPGQEFEGLHVKDPQHLLAAVQGTNEVLLQEEGLHINTADPWDPLNGSLADLLDTHQGNQWTLALVYLYILEGLGLPCALMGSAQRVFVRVGEPPLLLDPHSTSSTGSTSSSSSSSSGTRRSPAFLLDMAQPGVVYSYSPPVPAGDGSALQPADSFERSSSSSTSTGLVTDEWNRALHAFLQRHQHMPDSPMGDVSSNNEASSLADSDSNSTDSSSDSNNNNSSSSDARQEEFTAEYGSDGSCGWQELEVYAAEDAATRNSWKALYGPGALAEWGGSVSSSWQHYPQHDSSSASSWEPSQHSTPEGGATIGGMRAAEWLGVLDSPFARAAHTPFPEEAGATASEGAGGAGLEEAGGTTPEGAGRAAPEAAPESTLSQAVQGDDAGTASGAVDSMDTSCGSPVTATLDDGLDSAGAGGALWQASSSSSVNSGCEGSVIQLSWADVAAVGGLQPVSKRMLLQQLLGGMKLSLMMSGRQEELLLVLRYLRATDPFSLPDLRDMALCLAELRPEEAAPLLREYLAVAPGAPDADMVREVAAQVQLRVQLGRSRGW